MSSRVDSNERRSTLLFFGRFRIRFVTFLSCISKLISGVPSGSIEFYFSGMHHVEPVVFRLWYVVSGLEALWLRNQGMRMFLWREQTSPLQEKPSDVVLSVFPLTKLRVV